MNMIHDDDGPTTPREALELLEFQVQDFYDLSPNLRTAVALLEAELVRARGLEKACDAALEWAAGYPLGMASTQPDIDAAAVVYRRCHAALKGGD